ncbi:MAG: phage recombination protein Bet [Rhodocyclaceae bacterium]|nr:phage recombination protein Bet [Rhodocyclaceae bacterium]MCA3116388.1 phage recombination protein Bet [Rhodocyclaceae bacterium]MCA3127063.1 phage recombination protein Bet [Rhodocyclaceae bacterium]
MNDMVRVDAIPETEMLATLQDSLYPGAALASVRMVLAYCRAAGLDPMTKPVHIVPMQVKVKKDNGTTATVWRDVVLPGIELYRTKAARTGAYAGMDSAKWGPTVTREFGGEPKMQWDDEQQKKVPTSARWDTRTLEHSEWCEVTVYRIVQGQRCAFSSGQVWFTEVYATASNETSLPNAMWSKRLRGQHEKCAEALALRRAFPEVGGDNTREEMEGRVIEASFEAVDTPPGTTPVQQPKARSETKQAAAQATPATETAKAETQPSSAEPTGSSTASAEGGTITEGEVAHLVARLQKAGKTVDDLCTHFGLPVLADLPKARFQEARKWTA